MAMTTSSADRALEEHEHRGHRGDVRLTSARDGLITTLAGHVAERRCGDGTHQLPAFLAHLGQPLVERIDARIEADDRCEVLPPLHRRERSRGPSLRITLDREGLRAGSREGSKLSRTLWPPWSFPSPHPYIVRLPAFPVEAMGGAEGAPDGLRLPMTAVG